MVQTGDSSEMDDQPSILRPIPRRAFDLMNPSSETSTAPTPSSESSGHKMGKGTPPSRTPSVLNLTSSTLFGIYSPASYGDKDELPTPYGGGTQTPINGRMSLENVRPESLFEGRPRIQGTSSIHHHHSHPAPRNFLLSLAMRTILLFIFGVAYGGIITHLHDEQRLAPVQVESFNRYDWPYLIIWGIAGVGLGSLLPWVDLQWENKLKNRHPSSPIRRTQRKSSPKISEEDDDDDNDESDSESSSPFTGPLFKGDWNPVVRSIGAFVGIAFAIVSLMTPTCPSFGPSKLINQIAQTPLAVHASSLSNPRPRQSSSMVYHRPIETGILPLRSRRRDRNGFAVQYQPGHRPSSGDGVSSGFYEC